MAKILSTASPPTQPTIPAGCTGTNQAGHSLTAGQVAVMHRRAALPLVACFEPADIVSDCPLGIVGGLEPGLPADPGDVEVDVAARASWAAAVAELGSRAGDGLLDRLSEFFVRRGAPGRDVVETVIQPLRHLQQRDRPAAVPHVDHVNPVTGVRGCVQSLILYRSVHELGRREEG